MAKLKSFNELSKEILDNVEIMVNGKTSMTLLECVEKQVPRKMSHLTYCSNEGYYCPNCSKRLFKQKIENKHKCCYNCGQRIDYSECEEY